jgi:hypothetical protein
MLIELSVNIVEISHLFALLLQQFPRLVSIARHYEDRKYRDRALFEMHSKVPICELLK